MDPILCVAVPVNYGMLSYPLLGSDGLLHERRSPRQLWNALLQKKITNMIQNLFVAVPVNYGMLSYLPDETADPLD